jgi:hypothetical protein
MKPTLKIRAYRHGLRFTEERTGASRLEATDLDALRDAVGEGILVCVLRLFVWADRLQSLTQLAYFSDKYLGETSVAFSRNLFAMVWYVAGSIFEAADAIAELGRQGVRSRLRDVQAWDDLDAIGTNWRSQKVLIRLRNNIGFHVDAKIVKRGLDRAARAGDRVVILASDDDTAGRTTLRFGLECLLTGMGMTEADFIQTIKTIRHDQDRFGHLVEQVFLDLLKASGSVT